MGKAPRFKRGQKAGAVAGRHYVSTLTPLQMLQAACFHEAGHIVAAFALGFDVVYSIINTNQGKRQYGVGGYTEVRLSFLGKHKNREATIAASLTPEALKIRIVQTLAGQVGESCVHGNQREIKAGAREDEETAMRWAVWATRQADGSPAAEDVISDYLNERDKEVATLIATSIEPLCRVGNYLGTHLNERVPGVTLKALVEGQAVRDE